MSAPGVGMLTASDAEERQRRAAGGLRAARLAPGDRVAFCLGSSPDLLCAVLGAARTGVVPVVLNPALVEHERAALVADCEARLVVDDRGPLERLLAGAPVDLSASPLVRPIHYTSGTTGRPKGVSAGPWDEDTARAVVDDEAAVWGFGPDDLLLMCSPLHHTVSIRLAATTLLRGGAVALLEHFDAARTLDCLRRLRPTTAFMVPTHLKRLLALRELGDGRFDSLRRLIHAGEPCPPALKRAVMERVGPDVLWEFYGSTEGQFTVCSPSEWLERPGTVGRARPGRRLEIEGLDGPEGRGGIGRIWCHAPAHARFRYWRWPAATEEAWRGDAFTVGDLGHLDADDYLFLSGRRDDLIISGGVNVYPAEVEAVLAEVPGVHEVAVFGVTDERWGQRVCAAVVASGPSEEALRRTATERLAPHKRPKEYVMVDDLPHTATGKLRRGAVAALLGLEPGRATAPGG